MDEVERAFRAAHGQAVATLTRLFGDIGLAEDAVQDAFVTALSRWPRDGIPDNPAGWIVTTARHRAIDVLRRDRRGRDLMAAVAVDRLRIDRVTDEEPPVLVRDDQLKLLFTCCHPALRPEHQVALTLRLIAGLSPSDVAAAFLVSEETMAKRLVRTKYKIKAAGIPYRVPDGAELPDRLRAVLSVLYLVYNTGADDTRRADLRTEAIRLARLLVDVMPDEPEAAGLLGLMLLSEARARARESDGEMVLLRDQNRSLWDHQLIAEGQALVLACMRLRRLGPFQLQAAIHALHCAAARYEDTDWATILHFYDRLMTVMPTAVVALNRAIVVAETHSADESLSLLDDLAVELTGYHPLHAARGAMLDTLGRRNEAATAYARAAELATAEPTIRFLREQSARLDEAADQTMSSRISDPRVRSQTDC